MFLQNRDGAPWIWICDVLFWARSVITSEMASSAVDYCYERGFNWTGGSPRKSAIGGEWGGSILGYPPLVYIAKYWENVSVLAFKNVQYKQYHEATVRVHPCLVFGMLVFQKWLRLNLLGPRPLFCIASPIMWSIACPKEACSQQLRLGCVSFTQNLYCCYGSIL